MEIKDFTCQIKLDTLENKEYTREKNSQRHKKKNYIKEDRPKLSYSNCPLKLQTQ